MNPLCRILFGELPFAVHIYQAPVSAPAEVWRFYLYKGNKKRFPRIENQDKRSVSLWIIWPELLGILMDANDPVMIIFPFAMLSGVAHWNPSVAKPSVQHPHDPLGIHVTRGTCLLQTRAFRWECWIQLGKDGLHVSDRTSCLPNVAQIILGKAVSLERGATFCQPTPLLGSWQVPKLKRFMEKSNL